MKTEYTYDHYIKYDEITEKCTKYAEKYPAYARLSSLNKTPEGRNIWLMEITDLSTGSYDEKPGFAVTANIHAGEVQGNVCAMHFMDTIFTNIKEPEIAELLKLYTIYIIPRITPDGSELYLTTPVQLRSVPRMYPAEQLLPGLQPDDIDGDGVIRQMRIKDPAGAFKVSEKDPRMMVRRKPDDIEGDFYNVYTEGYLHEADPEEELFTAKAKYGNDLNRNFPYAWAPEHRQMGSGDYALSNIESRTMAEFTNSHKNLCTILHFHTYGGQYLYPPGYTSSKNVHREDMIRYREIGQMAVEETGYVCWNVRDEYMGNRPGEILGLFDDFCHFAMGLINYTCECWDFDQQAGLERILPNRARTEEESEEQVLARLKFIDEKNDGNGFRNWTKMIHPQLGEVETGGFDYKFVAQNCPVKFLPAEAEKHTRFLLRELKTLPRLAYKDTHVTKVGENQYKVETTIMNRAYLPTYVTREAVTIGRAEGLEVTLNGAEIVMGKAKENIGHLNGYWGSGDFGWGLGASNVNHEPVQKKLSWIVSAEEGTEITIASSCPRAGRCINHIVLK